MKKLISLVVLAGALMASVPTAHAQSGTVPEMGPRVFAGPVYLLGPVYGVSSKFYLDGTNATALYVGGTNIALGSLTNAMLVAGPYIGGNIPVASVTNATRTAGPYIGGNIPVAALTNAGPALASNVIVLAVWKGLPTSTNGLVSGQLWLNSNVLTIYP